MSEKKNLHISTENVIKLEFKQPIQWHQYRISDTDHFLPEQCYDISSTIDFQNSSSKPKPSLKQQRKRRFKRPPQLEINHEETNSTLHQFIRIYLRDVRNNTIPVYKIATTEPRFSEPESQNDI